MISSDYPLASWFLVFATSFFLVVVALPLLFVPLKWARVFRWKLPEEGKDLTVYFGRCLGAVSLAIIIVVAQGIPEPKSNLRLFDLVALTAGLMVAVHVWGALRRIQPMTETIETLFWAAVVFMALWLRYSTLA
ncbi:hypothetical protein SAMN05444354_10465 [Stigmatella aurantiaca]|uniref:DUF4345 domain-containing protein n=1 Tax=Stigmatella aurantiaca TaxID=41 RepID=A0A1H7MPF7_STIAU|nr:hypothetical protein [Stigmatella aurantiaca]SEL13206.1 hypothetical protein SAMN05444354_10465 [Stigmatella aurantiaca]